MGQWRSSRHLTLTTASLLSLCSRPSHNRALLQTVQICKSRRLRPCFATLAPFAYPCVQSFGGWRQSLRQIAVHYANIHQPGRRESGRRLPSYLDLITALMTVPRRMCPWTLELCCVSRMFHKLWNLQRDSGIARF
jgi:hypothetical protein